MSNQPQPTFKPRFDYAHMMQQVYQANGDLQYSQHSEDL